MRRPARLQQRLLAVVVCTACAGALAAAGGADTPAELRQRADQLRRANAALTAEREGALLALYSLDAQLEGAQARLAHVHARRAHVERERASVRAQLQAAHRTMTTAQRHLAHRLRLLYERGDEDPLAVLLGATSVREAISTLDDLERSAKLDERIAGDAAKARTHLRRVVSRLAAREAELRSLAAAAERTIASLRATRRAREQFVGSLTERQRLNESQLAGIEQQARTSVVRTRALTPARSAAVPVAPEPPPATEETARGGRTLTVVATGYALRGRTATGIPTAWGVIAVDPSVIPLGTQMTVPGYGAGVAADTGSAVRGAIIDLWFPTVAQALAWGRRTVTITLH